MNLRNILLAGLAVCTMASCSKDDDANNGPKAQVDAYVSFGATALIQTKAEPGSAADNLDNEKLIKTLDAYIFKDDGTLAGSARETAKEGETIDCIKHVIVKVTPESDETAPTADKFIAVLVANGAQQTVSSLDDLKTKVLTGSIETYIPQESALPMVSSEIHFTGLKPFVKGEEEHVENWANNGGTSSSPVTVAYTTTVDATTPTGYNKVIVTRMVARVQVEKLTVAIGENYPGATFELDTLSLVNVRPTAKLGGGFGDYVKGYQSPGYEKDQEWIFPNADVKEQLAKKYEFDAVANAQYDFNSSSYKDSKFYAYAFSNVPQTSDNGVYETALLITGKFKRNSAAEAVTKNFRVILKDNVPGSVPEILANHIYKLTVKITGEGSGNEDKIELNAHVAATVMVDPWNVIEQNEEDAN